MSLSKDSVNESRRMMSVGAGMVICLERGAELHMASKIQIDLPFWYRLTWVVPEKGPLNACV